MLQNASPSLDRLVKSESLVQDINIVKSSFVVIDVVDCVSILEDEETGDVIVVL